MKLEEIKHKTSDWTETDCWLALFNKLLSENDYYYYIREVAKYFTNGLDDVVSILADEYNAFDFVSPYKFCDVIENNLEIKKDNLTKDLLSEILEDDELEWWG